MTCMISPPSKLSVPTLPVTCTGTFSPTDSSLQHVIVRGNEKGDIFYDDKDRRAFLDRLSSMLLKTIRAKS